MLSWKKASLRLSADSQREGSSSALAETACGFGEPRCSEAPAGGGARCGERRTRPPSRSTLCGGRTDMFRAADRAHAIATLLGRRAFC
jgi:hypothetical protein